ncbi:DNase I-like protein [Suhomyces tanzawaensis NRRL Y-17324]|uniref:DNase I-like protein n=1 Tax=Suhomyces tanzawaensis NRRL Y-17324 TaxID=984487 RepID=A0A1E4SHL4_9ASCO|nr:DNase I-like protein [Suhomyces tanzawaensis NRRL Y-17324]ODV79004.1 DNase I-like protein [Suhomyces tanzawaensis NRRL Y-17324]
MTEPTIYVVSDAGYVFVPLVILVLIKSYFAMQSRIGTGHLPLNRPLKLRVYTHNIRYDNRGNRDWGEQPWSVRRAEVVNSIDFNAGATGYANVVCLQEVLHHQLEEIIHGLNRNAEQGESWTYYGVGRTDGRTGGEYAPILYKPSEWVLVENLTFWLSPTPEVPGSKGWDAALERIVTLVTLQLTLNPLVKLNFFNTHFDHRGVVARQKSAELIVDKMKNHNGYPSFLGGDFNTEPSDLPYGVLRSSGFKDSRTLIDPAYSYGANATFTGFNHEHEQNTIIDYIWSPEYTLSNLAREGKGDQESDRFGVILKHFGILNNFNKGFHCSDHRPVVANYEVTRKWF